MKKLLANCSGFEWDDGNSEKNWIAHQVSNAESEEIFFNRPLLVSKDKAPLAHEKRHFALGRTDANRYLFVAFTIRRNLIRVISARDMNERETRKYHERAKRNT